MSKPVKVKPENEVNAYLFYAQRLLHLLNSTSLINNHGDKMAITASVCLSLKQAWQAWLKELSVYVGTAITGNSALFLPENSTHPEVQLLIEVQKQPKNWLSELVLCFEPRLNTQAIVNTDDEEGLVENVSSSRIDVFQLDDKELAEEDKLKRVISEFKFYIQAARTRQAEW